MSPEDARRVEEVLQSDRNAFRHLVDKYWDLIVVLVFQKLGDRDEAEDIAQEVFWRAYRNLGRLRQPERFLPWVLRISRRLVADHFRSSRRNRPVSLENLKEEGLETQAPEVGSKLHEKEEHLKVLLAVGQLSEKYRLMITLRYFQGLSCEAIAGLLKEPAGTVRNRLFRAHRKLERLLTPEGNS